MIPSEAPSSRAGRRPWSTSWIASIAAITQQSPRRPCRGRCSGPRGRSGLRSGRSPRARGPGAGSGRCGAVPAGELDGPGPPRTARAHPGRVSARSRRLQVLTGGTAPGRSSRRGSEPGTSDRLVPTAGDGSVRRGGHDLLTGALHDVCEPGLIDVEGLVAGDALELDGAQAAVVALVMADHTGAALEGDLHREIGHRLDQA